MMKPQTQMIIAVLENGEKIMPKFKSPDGRIFDDIESARSYFCITHSPRECYESCRLHSMRNPKGRNCVEFCEGWPNLAARMMGYEIIEEETLIDGTNRLTDTLTMDEQEAKSDGGKPRPSLVPPALIDGVMRIREFGTARYGYPDNWRNVDAERYHNALLRHILAMWEDWKAVDPDSGMPHLWHAACNIAFLMQYMEEEDG